MVEIKININLNISIYNLDYLFLYKLNLGINYWNYKMGKKHGDGKFEWVDGIWWRE